MNVLDGRRINTAIAYLNPNRDRPNLTVSGGALVRRIIFNGLRATGVEVETADRTEVIAARLVVLAAGAIKSPHLLALSGVGPRAELAAAGIECVHHLPGVGKAFSDHPNLALTWRPRSGFNLNPDRGSFQGGSFQPGLFQEVLNFTSTGSGHSGDLEILPMLRPLAETLGLAQVNELTQPELALPDELAFLLAVQQAESRGDITTTSADPHVQPRIEYNYLRTRLDLDRMRQVIRTACAILRSQAFESIFGELSDLTEATLADDEELAAWIRAHLGTAIHACGSCAMGPTPDDGAVVDQFGRVHGLTGVRVADTSILPFAPSRGPAATAIMIGERMAEFIRSGPS
jgi:choline dehydrogenase-like flavoprotein